jgi:hypothetical protein
MDDLIAIRVTEEDGGSVAFLTWGRLFHPVDESEILAAVERSLPVFGVREYTKLVVCDNLGEVAGERYFYEGLFHFAAKFDHGYKNYESWRKKKLKRVKSGRDIFFLGRRIGSDVSSSKPPDDDRSDVRWIITHGENNFG